MSCIWTFSFPGKLIRRGSLRRTRAANVGPGQWALPPNPPIPPVPLQPVLPPVEISATAGPLRIEGMINPATHHLIAFQIRFVPQQFPPDPAFTNPIHSLAHAVPILGAHPAPHHMTFRPSHTVQIAPQHPFAAQGVVAVGVVQRQDRWEQWHEVVAISYDVDVREWNGAVYGPPQHLQNIIPLRIQR